MRDLFTQLWDTFTAQAPGLLWALLILVGAWLLALVCSALIRGALNRTRLDEKLVGWLGGERKNKIELAKWLSKGVFYLILLFGVIGFFNQIQLPQVSAPLNSLLDSIFEFAPRLLGAGALILLAVIVATLVRLGVTTVLAAVKLDDRLGETARIDDEKKASVSQSIANTLYWLVFLLFLPMILDALALRGLLQPVQAMLEQFLGFLPNLFAAGLILFFGWLVAKIVRQVVTNLLAAVGLDRVGQTTGVDTVLGSQTLSALVGTVLYVLILIPVAISALDTLELGSISEPASNMLSTILTAIPMVFTAALILALAYMVGKFAAGLVSELLARIGFNNLPKGLGLGWAPAEGQRTPSEMVGYLVLVATLFFASIEAARQLRFDSLSQLLVQFVEFGGHILLGLVIFVVGLYLANLAANLIQASDRHERGVLAMVARVAILALVSAMALREMGLADRIIEMAFGLLLFAVALAVALAFGLGSRESAGRIVESWSRYLKGEEK